MENSTRVKVDDLRAGMNVLEIVKLSSEYSYLDTRRIAFLQEQFKGTKAAAVRGGGEQLIPMDALEPGQEIRRITELSAAPGFGSVSPEMVDMLRDRGFLELLVAPFDAQQAPSAPAAQPAPSADSGAATASRPRSQEAPAFRSMGGLNHKKQVAEMRYFLEKVEQAEEERNQSTDVVLDLFQQGRANKYSTKPALECVEGLLRKDIAPAMAAVSGLRASDQTYAHCVDVATIFNEGAQSIVKASGRALNKNMGRSMLAAGFLHDIGKSKVSRDILDSTARFAVDSPEMMEMRSHVTHSNQILTDLGMDKSTINVAHYHHVKKDTSLPSSYPAVEFSELIPLTRLAAIIDVYQALTGKRSYKKNMPPAVAVQYLRERRGTEFDEAMMDNFINFIGVYPVGSLVRISTGDLAFVTKVEGQELERPVVAVIENAKGEILSTNPMLNLMEEPDLSIADAVDHYEHYDASLDESYNLFKSLNIV